MELLKSNLGDSNSGSDGSNRITITLPTNAYFMSGIRDFTLTMIKNTTNFPEKWAFRFQSVVDELCNNAIEYGSSKGSEIGVTFNYKEGEFLEIRVEDTGSGSQRMKASELEKLYKDRRAPDYIFSGIRGRGLVKIVGEWTDEIKFEDRPEGGLAVTVKKYLKDSRMNFNYAEVDSNLVKSNEDNSSVKNEDSLSVSEEKKSEVVNDIFIS